MKTPQSSNIQEIKYSKKKRVLSVDFHPNTKKKAELPQYTYIYSDVPEEIWKAFQEAKKKKESIGQLFFYTVQNVFKFEKVLRKGKKNVSN